LIETQDAVQVVSIGDLVADLVVTIPDLPVQASQHQHARSIHVEPGGAGNFLIAGARLGMQMRAVGTLGDDFFGQAVAARLEAENVDLAGVIRTAGSTTTTVIVLIDDHGGHVFLGAYGEGPKISLPASWTETIAASQAVFSAGYTLQEKRISDATFEAMDFAKQHAVPVFFDPGFEMARCSAEQKQHALSASQVLLLTEEELPILSGQWTGVEAARSLLDAGPELVCVKRGPNGCIIISRDQAVTHPGYAVKCAIRLRLVIHSMRHLFMPISKNGLCRISLHLPTPWAQPRSRKLDRAVMSLPRQRCSRCWTSSEQL
jgi:fructokinase